MRFRRLTKKEFKIKVIAAIIMTAMFCTAYLYISYTRLVDIENKVVTIIIKPGDNLTYVCNQLFDKGVVKSKLMLKYPARFLNLDKKLTPGRYDFTGSNSCQSVLERLEKADFLKLKITIPEGSTIWESASLLAKSLELDSARIHNLDNDKTFLSEFNLPGLEGYLFPETYFIPWGIDEKNVVKVLLNMYRTQTESLNQTKRPNGLNMYEIIILASIIEAETGLVDERTTVSSVYNNRLKRKMKLDADPTVIYGLGGLDRPLWRKDLRKDTPYNTYMHKGLPPTPINSPGLASIKAAMNPDLTDFLYFVADDSGRHVFSKTNAEHNRAIRKIRSKN